MPAEGSMIRRLREWSEGEAAKARIQAMVGAQMHEMEGLRMRNAYPYQSGVVGLFTELNLARMNAADCVSRPSDRMFAEK